MVLWNRFFLAGHYKLLQLKTSHSSDGRVSVFRWSPSSSQYRQSWPPQTCGLTKVRWISVTAPFTSRCGAAFASPTFPCCPRTLALWVSPRYSSRTWLDLAKSLQIASFVRLHWFLGNLHLLNNDEKFCISLLWQVFRFNHLTYSPVWRSPLLNSVGTAFIYLL